MNAAQVKGRIREAEGKIKAVAGRLVGNRRMEAKGHMQQAAGLLEASYGDLKNNMRRGG